MAPRWGSNRAAVSATRLDDRACHATPARPDARQRSTRRQRHVSRTRADDRRRRSSSRVARAPFECPSRPRRRASARHGDATASCEAMRRSSARACVGGMPRAKRRPPASSASARRANASFAAKKKPRSDARIQLAVQRTSKESWPDEAHQVPENFGVLSRRVLCKFCGGDLDFTRRGSLAPDFHRETNRSLPGSPSRKGRCSRLKGDLVARRCDLPRLGRATSRVRFLQSPFAPRGGGEPDARVQAKTRDSSNDRREPAPSTRTSKER